MVLAIGALLLVVAGSALASPGPRTSPPELLAASHAPEAPPTGEELGHAAERLQAHGIVIARDRLAALAADYGLGGAVRLAAWADATGRSIADLRAMRDGGAGWGQMAHELGVHPGLGSIMGGGQGREDAPGQQ
jgi:hypothetical protein